MTTVTVSEKGQVVIPSQIRHSLGITAGTKLEMTIEQGGIKILVESSRKTRTAASCIGSTGYLGERISTAQMDAARFASNK